MKDHPLMTEEVRTLCEDLRVLGEEDLKHLSKWRMLRRKALAPSEAISNQKAVVECESEEDEDKIVVKEMEELEDTELRKRKREKRLLAKRQAKDKAREVLGMQSDATGDGYVDQDLFSLTLIKGGDEDGMTHSAQDSDIDKGDDEVNPLVIRLETTPSQEEVVKTWFTQDVFVESEEQDMLDKYNSDDEMLIDRVGERALKSKTQTDDELQVETLGLTEKIMDGLLQVPASATAEDFEIVPAPPSDSSDLSSDESDELGDDIDRHAEILAAAKKMILKTLRELMMDDGYNKYMFHDEGLPKWYMDEEKRHRQPIKPVTKEEVAAMRAQFKAINARPAKKVAEAKARKKRGAQRKLEKVRKKANSISDLADISDLSKSRMIEQLYKRATPKTPEKEYVVAKKGVQVKIGKGKVLVDRRMKKDARRHGMIKQGVKKVTQKRKGPQKASSTGKN